MQQVEKADLHCKFTAAEVVGFTITEVFDF